MITFLQNFIKLEEYKPSFFPEEQIPKSIGKILWQNYKNQLDIEFPSIKTDHRWQLTSLGWVGHLPVTNEFSISLLPKVPIGNLFRMLEYAYRLKSFSFLDGLIECDSIQEFYERLANVLSLRILDRGKKGFYRCYLPYNERIPYIRGRIDLRHKINKPWDVDTRCHFDEHTSDIEDNQILFWTLAIIARSGMCTERVLPNVRRAYRALQGLTSLTRHSPESCVRRIYNRLNDDYQPLHALCKFFLEQSGPMHEIGDRPFLPFMVNMARLYELFVAEWLKKNLSPNLFLKAQEKVVIGEKGAIHFAIDLVIYEKDTGEARFVLDTKYKTPDIPDPTDISKVNTYADSKNCNEAILIYPQSLKFSIDEKIGNNRIRSLSFTIDGDLDQAGKIFLRDLFFR